MPLLWGLRVLSTNLLVLPTSVKSSDVGQDGFNHTSVWDVVSEGLYSASLFWVLFHHVVVPGWRKRYVLGCRHVNSQKVWVTPQNQQGSMLLIEAWWSLTEQSSRGNNIFIVTVAAEPHSSKDQRWPKSDICLLLIHNLTSQYFFITNRAVFGRAL